MQKITSHIVSGMIGGLVCFGLLYMTKTSVLPNDTPKAQLAGEQSISKNALSIDFVEAAKKTTPAVVHIVANQSEELAMQEMQKNRRNRSNPFQDFFGFDDFFGGDIFGNNFYRPKSGSGSGVIYSKDGYIVTNNHVVGFADNITVTTSDGKKYKATKIGTDKSTDLAVIKIEGSNFPTIALADSDKLQVGEWVLAVGNPFDYLTSTVTAGIVSAKGRELDIIEGDKKIEEFIQTDAAINPGNSGGALVTSTGELVGINTAIATPTGVYAGYSFAIPVNLVKKIVKEIIENGDIERLGLGVAGYDVDQSLIDELDLKVKTGFYVDEVELKSAAKYAGILPGDVIISVDGKKISKFADIAEVMKFSKKGDKLDIVVNRNGKEINIPTPLRKGL